MRCKKQPFRDDASASSIHYFSSRDCLLVSSMKFDGKWKKIFRIKFFAVAISADSDLKFFLKIYPFCDLLIADDDEWVSRKSTSSSWFNTWPFCSNWRIRSSILISYIFTNVGVWFLFCVLAAYFILSFRVCFSNQS